MSLPAPEGSRSAATRKRSPKAPREPAKKLKPAPKDGTAAADFSADGITRCPWSTMYRGAGAEAYIRYHDDEWGVPVRDDRQLFELLVLEGAQAGLSWSTILNKREAYRRAFMGFDPNLVADMGEAEVQLLLEEGSGIVRHKAKILSAINNAKCVLKIQEDHGSLSDFVWGFMPEGKPRINTWTEMGQVPSRNPEAEKLSAGLKAAGMNFIGPTTCYAFMQAAGLVNDHLTSCHCYKKLL